MTSEPSEEDSNAGGTAGDRPNAAAGCCGEEGGERYRVFCTYAYIRILNIPEDYSVVERSENTKEAWSGKGRAGSAKR